MSNRPEPQFDPTLQAAIEAEKFLDGPASPDLCKKLGIHAEDLASITAEQKVLPQVKSREELRIQHATEAVTEEMVRTKEAVLTVLATYISNRDARWWARPASERLTEVDFVANALVRTYHSLDMPCPPK